MLATPALQHEQSARIDRNRSRRRRAAGGGAKWTATPFLGGESDFTVAIVGRLAVLNVLWLIGLVAACEVFRLLTSALRQQARL
jgi:hypothetical protein